MRKIEELLKKFDYAYPKELIAQSPATPRDTARLLVYHRATKNIHDDIFRHLAKYLPARSILVLNQTKVIPARLMVTKETGGAVALLYIGQNQMSITALANRPLAIGSIVQITPRFHLRVKSRKGGNYCFIPLFPMRQFTKLLHQYGRTPLPPYIKNSPLSESRLKKEYQSILAKTPGSIAAPTASLHFTKSLLKKLRNAGHDIHVVTLHVGLGTFAPLSEKNIAMNQLHEESYTIDTMTARDLNRAKREGRPIIAVGTTVVRTLESAANNQGTLKKGTGSTRIFIQPGYHFKFVDGIITNFHVPRSSLLMLVSAFANTKEIKQIYQHAIERKYRLFSFGDGMVLL